jgi:hypothetical protein
MNRFILSQNRVQSRTRNVKVTLTPRHCKPDGDGSLGFVKKIGMYIHLGQLTCLLAYFFSDLLITCSMEQSPS